MNLFEKALGAQTRWSSFENVKAQRAGAALENNGAKGHAFDRLAAGETKTLLDVGGSGIVHRIWMTISDRSPEMLRSLRLDMTWDHASNPAVSVPLGDFFGIGLGRKAPFECALFSDPEGRSFNSFVPMPFRTAARISITNESGKDLSHLFYDINSSGSGAFVRLMDLPQPVDLRSAEIPDGWCNFWRQDDWSATVYFYLDAPGGVLPQIPPAAFRAAGLTTDGDPCARKDA